MILEPLLEKLHIRAYWTKLIVGSALTALTISLGTVIILDLFDFSINPSVPGVLAAVGAATYAARIRREPPNPN